MCLVMQNNSVIENSEILKRLSTMKVGEKKDSKKKEEVPVEEGSQSKLTQITFNNFDGEKIRKHNESLKKSELENEQQKDDRKDSDGINKDEQKESDAIIFSDQV